VQNPVNLPIASRLLLIGVTLVSTFNILLITSPKAMAQIQIDMPAFISLQSQTPGRQLSGHGNVSGTLIAGQFKGDAPQTTNIESSNLATGTVPDARFGANFPLLDGQNTWSGADNFFIMQNSFAGDGQLLNTLNASNLTSGSLPDGRFNLSGDLAGPLSTSTVVGLRSRPVSPTVPQAGQTLGYDGNQWAPATDVFSVPFSRTVRTNSTLFSLKNTGSGGVLRAWSHSGTGLSVASGGGLNADNGRALDALAMDPGVIAIVGNGVDNATAARFLNSGFYADLASPSGALVTNGYLWKDYTANQRSVAVPIAFGVVSVSGEVLDGTGNFSAVRAGVGQIDITVNGETYDDATFVVTLTPVSTADRHACVSSEGSAFRVNVFNQAGNLTDTMFKFTVWTRTPSTPG